MKKKENISEAVIRRLPLYYHCLKGLEGEGISRVSSNIISGMLNITASQVRQDFSNFGEFGQQGYGYDVAFLRSKIAGILGLDKRHRIVIIGGGRIGQALAGYEGFVAEGFDILSVFDVQPEGKRMPGGVPIRSMKELPAFIKQHPADIAVIATPASAAKSVAAEVKKLGIRSVWNFAPVFLYLGEDIAVQNINMSESLFMLAYRTKALLSDPD